MGAGSAAPSACAEAEGTSGDGSGGVVRCGGLHCVGPECPRGVHFKDEPDRPRNAKGPRRIAAAAAAAAPQMLALQSLKSSQLTLIISISRLSHLCNNNRAAEGRHPIGEHRHGDEKVQKSPHRHHIKGTVHDHARPAVKGKNVEGCEERGAEVVVMQQAAVGRR